jgi:superfamily II DNA/RNA helicase
MANNHQELQLRIKNALDVRQSISVGNVEEYLNHLQYMPAKDSRERHRPLHHQYTEVLPESSKRETLLELFRYIFQIDTYKNIKILVFVRSLTIEKIKEIDGLLHNEMMRVIDHYPNFNRNYAHRNSDENVIVRNTKNFMTSANSVLITDVDAKTLGNV